MAVMRIRPTAETQTRVRWLAVHELTDSSRCVGLHSTQDGLRTLKRIPDQDYVCWLQFFVLLDVRYRLYLILTWGLVLGSLRARIY